MNSRPAVIPAVTIDGNKVMVDAFLKETLELRLFASKPDEDIKELTGYGYKAIVLEPLNVTKTQSGVFVSYKPVQYIFEGPAGLIYGSYAYHPASKSIVWIDPLLDPDTGGPDPFKVVNNGDALTIQPLFKHGG